MSLRIWPLLSSLGSDGRFEVEDFGGEITWDAFFLFGSDAGWGKKPHPLLSSGFPIRLKREELRRAWDALFQC